MDTPVTEIQNIGHLGIIAAIFKKYKIIEKIDNLLPKSSNNKTITHGQAILAMVLQGLGFSSQRLYLSSDFFSHVALKELLGPDVKPEYFNSAVLGRTLDAIFKYGATKFFTDTCLGIVLKNNLLTKIIHSDTTSFSVTGRKYKNKGNFELKCGYSKDSRMDLKQLVYLLVSTSDGIPILAETFSGNQADNAIFQDTIEKLQNLIKSDLDDKYLVLDSSLYNKAFLKNQSITGHWITRVPESVKSCKELVSKRRLHWIQIDDNFKYAEVFSNYGGRTQRWIEVNNREARHRELATLKKKLDKEES